MSERPSVTPPLFENSAKEILTRLEGDTSEEAEEIRKEARELIKCFREWMVKRPSDLVRLDVVNRLFALYRKMTDHLLRKR